MFEDGLSESKLYRLPLSMQTRISLTAQHLHTTRTPPPHFKIARSRTLSLSHIPHIHTALLNTRPRTSYHITFLTALTPRLAAAPHTPSYESGTSRARALAQSGLSAPHPHQAIAVCRYITPCPPPVRSRSPRGKTRCTACLPQPPARSTNQNTLYTCGVAPPDRVPPDLYQATSPSHRHLHTLSLIHI